MQFWINLWLWILCVHLCCHLCFLLKDSPLLITTILIFWELFFVLFHFAFFFCQSNNKKAKERIFILFYYVLLNSKTHTIPGNIITSKPNQTKPSNNVKRPLYIIRSICDVMITFKGTSLSRVKDTTFALKDHKLKNGITLKVVSFARIINKKRHFFSLQ